MKTIAELLDQDEVRLDEILGVDNVWTAQLPVWQRWLADIVTFSLAEPRYWADSRWDEPPVGPDTPVLWIQEACDNWGAAALDLSDVDRLIEFLQAARARIADQLTAGTKPEHERPHEFVPSDPDPMAPCSVCQQAWWVPFHHKETS